MATATDYESFDEEVKELLKNYKNKRATVYEPCTLDNYRECLIGLSEELGLLNINYVFNPYINVDVENNTLETESLIKLINSVWTLLHHHKNTLEKVQRLTEQNHDFEQNTKQLNVIIARLKDKSSSEKNETRACVSSAQRISDRSEEIITTLSHTRLQLTQVKKQKETTEKCLKNEIGRLRLENDKLMDRLRIKSVSFTPCSEVCDSTVLQLRERDRKQRALIAQLQENNQQLIREVISMKEELILGGLSDYKLDEDNNNRRRKK